MTASSPYTFGKSPANILFLGSAVSVAKNPLHFTFENMMTEKDIVSFLFMGAPMIQLNHPDLIRYVLMENHRNYEKGELYLQVESALGKGLITSNGEKWKRDRQAIQPMFRREQVENCYFEVIHEVMKSYRKKWLNLTINGSVEINIAHEMSRITIEVILKSIFGSNIITEKEVEEVHHYFDIPIEYLKNMRLLPRVDLRKLFQMPAYYRFSNALKEIERIFSELGKRYKESSDKAPYNMLSLLWAAQHENPENFTNKDINDHLVTMIFAGFETTSIGMQWMWLLLDENPKTVEDLREEINSNTKDELTIQGLNQMEKLGAAFKETLRLYPPFWVNGRSTVKDDKIGGYDVKAGTTVWLPQFAMHRHPRWWKTPNAFLPERFAGEAERNVDPGVYFPFSQGPRKCSGFKFAEMEAKIVFALLLPQFNVAVINAGINSYSPDIALKFKYPLRVKISRRSIE